MPVTNLNQFGDRYRVQDDGTDDSCRDERVWCMEIRGKRGTIYSYGLDGSLAVFVNSRKIAQVMAGLGYKRVQAGRSEFTYKFPLADIHKVARLIKARKRRQLSPEQKAALVLRLKGGAGAVVQSDSKAVSSPEEAGFGAQEPRSATG